MRGGDGTLLRRYEVTSGLSNFSFALLEPPICLDKLDKLCVSLLPRSTVRKSKSVFSTFVLNVIP